MADSLRISTVGLEKIDRLRKTKGWTKKALVWVERANDFLQDSKGSVSVSTLGRFLRGIPVRQENFVAICQAVGIENWREVVDNEPKNEYKPELRQYDSSWVGRTELVECLIAKIQGSVRLLLLLGLTGIGKTALAEKLVIELEEWIEGNWKRQFWRVNFDWGERSRDFASVAKEWLEGWGEKISSEQNTPEYLLKRTIQILQSHRVLVLVDSLESLLTDTEDNGWGDFEDDWWRKFFLNVLAIDSCQSRLIITSQDLPIQVVNDRFSQFWHKEIIKGLGESEQIQLFQKADWDKTPAESDLQQWLRLGKAYDGHPLVLRVMLGEIIETFQGNIKAYWNEVQEKIEEVERAISEAEKEAKNVRGDEDEWQLHRLTRAIKSKVNEQRLESVFKRLKDEVHDAYLLICVASVYRRPVQEEGWLMQLVSFTKRLEGEKCSLVRQEKAMDELSHRFLVETSVNHNNKLVLGQHNLVRSVALQHHQQFLKELQNQG
ncbi:NB-ARC domain-containing protein [Roseofilum casamattae]|uniref:AAA family ATPase n=2 Tax=Roseofilum casamattae BLCC-M143 TaxID=3022442 RepID=A0ABT7C351_9CYAN|nr:NB-ARC domain-containing protein [Roseofilum casamattae]MDJ1185879.1 AAA family ATPase [Roseofilum casamattae BLCC-M143]